MKIKIYLILTAVMLTLFLAPVLASGQYEDTVTDPAVNVFYRTWDGSYYKWEYDMGRPDVDIRRASIEEIHGYINVSLEVEGTIVDDELTHYLITLRDENNESYEISFNDGYCNLTTPESSSSPEYDGVGTSTFEVNFSLEYVGNPGSLRIAVVETYEWLDEEGTGEYFYDTAGPEADYPRLINRPFQPHPPAEERDSIPGFALTLIMISIATALTIYHKKSR